MRKILVLLVTFLLGIALVGCGSEKATNNDDSKNEPKQAEVSLEGVLDAKEWGKVYPTQYESWMKNSEESNPETKYGGSGKVPKSEAEPEILTLFAGYGFSKEYNEDRGHFFAVEDLYSSARVNEKTVGSCLNCKSADVPGLVKEMGDDFYGANLLTDIKPLNHNNMSCTDCHNSSTLELEITREPLKLALESMGIDVEKATQEEMKTYVCAQCHVEYYFAPENKKVTFPWAQGTEPEEVLTYFETDMAGFKDWEHPDSGAGMIKVQHPEYETWRTGLHGKMGQTCADCHMPTMKDQKGEDFTSHWMTSPLKHIDASCAKCHSDTKALKDKLFAVQDKVQELQTEAGELTVEAHEAIKAAAAKAGVDSAKLDEARKKVVQAQFYWDWVAAENSRGFHNSTQSERSLNQAIELAKEAKDLAEQAAK